MGREYIPLFLDFNETTEALTDEECGRLIRAIVDYANGESEFSLETSGEKIAFQFLKGIVDRNASISEARARAGASKGNKTEQNGTNGNKTEQNETKSVTKTKTKNRNPNQDPNQSERFDRFWSAYPRKVAKPDARRKFMALNPDDELLGIMLAAIEAQKRSEQWTKDNGQFVPYPSTWIHQRRWEDEVKPVAVISPKRVVAQDYDQRDYSGVQDEILNRQAMEIEEMIRRKGAG